MYNVYKISFEDGYAYVGQTKYPVEDRIRRHLNNPDNVELSRRLESEAYVAEVLYENIPTFEIATQIESDEIYALEKPINISRVNPDAQIKNFGHKITKRNGRKKPNRQRQIVPRPGEYKCSRCQVIKPHTEFQKDRTRFNGLHSRCKVCIKELRQQPEEKERKNKYLRTRRKTTAYKEQQSQRKEVRLKSGLPQYLRSLRVKAEYSQQVLANRFGVFHTYISSLENGYADLSPRLKAAYEKEFGLNMDIMSFLEQKYD